MSQAILRCVSLGGGPSAGTPIGAGDDPAPDVSPAGRCTRRAAGFTLVELLVVLAILGLLVGVVTPQVIKYLSRARTDTARLDIQNIEASLDLFRLDVGRYPTDQEGLAALAQKPPGLDRWQGPYTKQRSAPVDPWGRPYHYQIPGQHGEYDLYTFGADNAPGGTGEDQDVTNWDADTRATSAQGH